MTEPTPIPRRRRRLSRLARVAWVFGFVLAVATAATGADTLAWAILGGLGWVGIAYSIGTAILWIRDR